MSAAITFVNGHHLIADGTVAQIERQLSPRETGEMGFNHVTVDGMPVAVNREHVVIVREHASQPRSPR